MLELKNIIKNYVNGCTQQVLKGINLTVNDGDFLAIMGPSGSGKSTMMNIIGLLDMPDSGDYIFDGEKIENISEDEKADIRGKKIGFIFQSFNLIPRLSVMQQVMMPLSYQGVGYSERTQRAQSALDKVGIPEKGHSKPNQLSGGQQQRVAIARAIVTNPSIILADEPTGNLDSKSGKEVMDIFTRLNKEGNTIVLITHDIAIAKYAKKIIHIYDGMIKEGVYGQEQIPLAPFIKGEQKMKGGKSFKKAGR